MTNMNATIYEKHGKYQISISWTVNGKRFRKSKATGLPVKGNKRKAQAMGRCVHGRAGEQGFGRIYRCTVF